MFSQGEIIDRKTKAGKTVSLRIKRITHDSIFYKDGDSVKSMALVDIIAYRKDYIEEYVFPNPADKEKYEIKDMRAIEKIESNNELKIVDKKEMLLRLLKNYKVPKETMDYATLQGKMILTRIDNGKQVKASPKRSFFLVLKNDPRVIELKVKPFKIIDDSILYIRVDIAKKDKRVYGIPVKDIKYVKLESQKKFVTRMIAGGLSCGLIIFLPMVVVPVYVFSHPFIDRYDLERTWKLKLKE